MAIEEIQQLFAQFKDYMQGATFYAPIIINLTSDSASNVVNCADVAEKKEPKQAVPTDYTDEVVNLNIDKAGTVRVDGRTIQPTSMQETSDVLNSEKARRYWNRLQASGFTDNEHRLMPTTTRKQAMLIAEAFAEKMEIKAKWKSFQQLWGISNLAQEKWENLENGINTPRQDEIEQIFEE